MPAAEKAGLVRQVFESVAPRYDLMNDLMSGGVHRLWKNALVDVAEPAAGRAVPRRRRRHRRHRLPHPAAARASGPTSRSATSTRRCWRSAATAPSIAACWRASTWTTGDAEALPFPDRSFDAYTIAFGLRNVTDIDKALGEAHRVLKPGGRFFCLEFSKVTSAPLGRALRRLLRAGRCRSSASIVAGDAEAYRYLHESIRRFPPQRELAERMRDGRASPTSRWRDMTLGVVALHSGLAHLTAVMLRALRNRWRLLRMALSLARHDALFPLETLGIAPALIALGAAVAPPPRPAPARRAAGGGAAGDGAELHQARPGAVDPRRSA